MSGKRILYIEDNSDNRLLIKRVLEAEGYIVVEAETGLKGLELAASSQPDLILMDINLPEIDGYECTNRLRKIPGGDRVPIIALTANAMEGDAQKALDAGCNGYIPKPIDVDHLPGQIEKYLVVSKPEAEAARPAAVQPPSPQPEAPAASTPAPSSAAPNVPASASAAPTPGTAASSTPAPSAPAPSTPAAPSTPSSTPPVPDPAASPSSKPVASPSPQPSSSQGQNSQAPNAQTPNPQSRGSQN